MISHGPLYLGWQYATPVGDPGPPPRRPVPPERQRDSAGWLAAQRREENLLNRPLKLTAAASATLAAAVAACAAGGLLAGVAAAPALAACLAGAAASGYRIRRGQRVLRDRAEAERARAGRLLADRERQFSARQAEYASRAGQWQAQRSAFAAQKRWYAVGIPDGIDRVDVAGGTLAGWSALLTMTAAHRLAAGGEVTVIDLSGAATAADLVGLSAAAGVRPVVWVLPRDLPRLDLADSLAPAELATVLALSASAAGEPGAGQGGGSARDLAIDTAILDRVTGVLAPGGAVSVGRVTAALRALAEVGDPRADVASGLLTEREVSSLGALFGRGAADRVVLERALGIEAQLRALEGAGTEPVSLPRGRLRVIAVDKRCGALPARVIAGFVVAALTHLVDRAPDSAGQTSWRHTLCLLGAERLRDDVLDRLTDACERTRCGLVLAYRSLPQRVAQRIGRGNAVVAFMRLGNAAEAKAASDQIGTEHRFLLSQLTETIGTSVTDTAGASYTSTVSGSASAAASSSASESASLGASRSRAPGRGFARPDGGASVSAQAGTSRGTSESVSLTAGIAASTAWGISTSRATGDSDSVARSMQRTRELVVEPSELQRLPATAMIVSYPAAAGRQVLLADANPAIGALPAATMAPLGNPFSTGSAAAVPGPRPGPGQELTDPSRRASRRGAARAGERIASAAMDQNTQRLRLPMRARLAATVGGAAASVSRLAGKGDGSVIGGVISLRLQPDLLTLLAAGRQVVLVTGTNGKTTTTRLITAALAPLGSQIASNIYGANMEAGLASALSRAPDAPFAVLETDEKYIPAMVKATRPRVVTLLNLSRDQMDRAAEIWLLARRWREALAAAPDCRVVANADDPLVAWAAGAASQVTWVAAGQRWREDSWCCPNCGAHLRRDGDDWSCQECGSRRPPVSWMLYEDQVIDPSGRATPLELALPGRANRSNAVVALAVAEAFGVHLVHALKEVRAVTSVAGRYTQVRRRGCDIRLLLAKNPAGWLEALDVMAPAPVPVLLAVNAQGPDGRDTSWLWDVDYRRLRGRTVLVGGERRLDLAVRLEADEVEFQLVDSIDGAVDAARAVSDSLEVLANYTAFQQYRTALGRAQ